jgi:hypothetical protein
MVELKASSLIDGASSCRLDESIMLDIYAHLSVLWVSQVFCPGLGHDPLPAISRPNLQSVPSV